TFEYASVVAGSDIIKASLTNLTNTNLDSGPVTANWTSSAACPAPGVAPVSATSLIYVGQTSLHVGDSLLAAALLTDGNGNALGSQTVSFTFQNSQQTVSTDSTGVARATFSAASAGSATLSASFAGSTSYSASSTSATISILQEDTQISYSGPTMLTTSGPEQLTARLTDVHHQAPLANRTLTFQIGSMQASAVTDSNGNATAPVTLSPSQTTGPGQIQVSFAGDSNYKPSFTAVPVVIALSTSFVIWGGNSGALQRGQDVNFWGAQWESQVTGGDFTGNPSFKGYADDVTAIQLCEPLAATGQQSLTNQCWTAKPGNSSPPATVPAYIEVIVSTAITKSGSHIYGNIASLAILKVDATPAYGPNPGHPGYGVIVAVVQDGAQVFPAPAVLSATQSQPATLLPGESYNVTAVVTNTGQATADNVTIAESFDGTQPPSGTQTDASLAAGAQFSASFPETTPTYPAIQSNETSTAYQTRLAGIDGRRFTSTGSVSFTDATGEPYLPVSLSAYSVLQIPRLDVALTGPSCVAPGASVPYVVTLTNLGSAAAASSTAVLTLPDGTTKTISVSNLAAGTSSVSTVYFQLPALTPQAGGETTEQYLARLAAADGTLLTASVNVNWQDAQGNNYGTISQQASSTTQRVPILRETPSAPATILPGSTATLNFTVQNSGSGNAIETDLSVENPDGSTSLAVPFSLSADSSASANTSWHAPTVGARQSGESDTAYLSRLAGLDNAPLTFNISMSWKDAAGSRYGPTSGTAASTRVLPVVSVATSGAMSANVGDTITYAVTLQNLGHAPATTLSLVVTLPDGSTVTPALPPGGLAAGASAQLTATYLVPASQAGTSINARASETWTDSSGNSYGPLSSTAATQVTNPNLPPVVSAGTNQTIELPTNTVALQGSAAPGRPGGSVTSLWSQVSGPGAVTLADATQPVTTATFPVAGTYVLKLTATDGTLESSATVTITVAPVNQPPVVSAGSDQSITYPTNTVTLAGTATDDGYPLGSSLALTWSQILGPGTVTFAPANHATTQATFSLTGTYVLRLSASDGQYTSTADVRVVFNS
ncbi:MAG TPA: CARDB domain-containing protein, partial [Aggregatilineaceae bacterium]|nr:CARDB domain-containing protein [Aggregatilineaceae bacterium]